MTPSSQVRALAARIYDGALDRGEPFTLADLQDRLAADLFDCGHLVEHLTALAADSALRAVDKERTAAPPQSSLFDLLEQAVPIADGGRLARRNMTMQDWSAHLAHVGENAARVNSSAAKENLRFAALAAYLIGDTTTEGALKAWQADNPGAVLP